MPDPQPAGRELDAAVAVALFGWAWRSEDPEQPEQVPYLIGPDSAVWYPKLAAKFPGVPLAGGHELPAYSTDIAAAWEVAEKLGLLVSPALFDRLQGYSKWGAGVFQGRTGHDDGGHRYVRPGTWAEGMTAPEAICRAALAAARGGSDT